jgi:predicted Zn-dependent protease
MCPLKRPPELRASARELTGLISAEAGTDLTAARVATTKRAMNKRLEMLEKLLANGQADSFARYALAMEYRKEKRVEDALGAFQALRDADPDYLPMYLMVGQLLLDEGRPAEAKPWLEAGIALARKKGDGKAEAELEAALAVS